MALNYHADWLKAWRALSLSPSLPPQSSHPLISNVKNKTGAATNKKKNLKLWVNTEAAVANAGRDKKAGVKLMQICGSVSYKNTFQRLRFTWHELFYFGTSDIS